jgi:putative redox protein
MHPENGGVTARTGNGLYTEVTPNGYSMVVDEPVAFGGTGTGTGPTPYDYLLAALGGCTAMTARICTVAYSWKGAKSFEDQPHNPRWA